MRRARRHAVALAAALVLLGAGPAPAHLIVEPGTRLPQPVDAPAGIDVTFEGLAPSAEGVEVEVARGGVVALRHTAREPLVVFGIFGEPFLDFTPDGTVFLNLRSPSAAGATPGAPPDPTEVARANGDPKWFRVGEGGRFTWHDDRLWEPAVPAGLSTAAPIRGWEIPVSLGARTGVLRGQVVFDPDAGAPDDGSAVPVVLAVTGTLLLCAVAALVIVGRRRRPDQV